MAANFLKRYYLDDNKLRQRALLEFRRAHATGRMIAFTGAMTTEIFGFGSWKELNLKIANITAPLIDDDKKFVQALIKKLFEQDKIKDPRVAFSILAEAVDQSGKGGHGNVEQEISTFFRDVTNRYGIFNNPQSVTFASIPYALIHEAGITRFATLNYDLELERVAMFPHLLGDEKWTSVLDELDKKKPKPGDGEIFRWEKITEGQSGRIRRVLAGGKAVESDLLNRERVDRLLEFAIGSDDVDAHIMHLHGRIDHPASMAVSYRDYDRLYRRNDMHKAPFEFAKRILIGGNPIMFIGLGMTETEVNRELEDFISNRPYNRVAPTFLLWNAKGMGMNDDEQKMKRLDMLHRLGVFVIFDSDLDGDEVFIPPLPDSREVALSPYSYASVIEEASKAETNSKKRELLNLRHFFPTLIETTKQVGNREEHIGQHWRSMKSRVSLEKKIISDIWPVDLNGLTAPDGIKERINPAIEALNEIQPTHDFICVIGPSGIGKGTIAREFASQFNGGIRKENRLCVNGGFSFDTDSLLDGIAWFLSHRRQGCQSPYTANGQFKLSRSEFLAKPEILNLLPNGELSQPDTLIIINGMERFFSIKGQPISAEFEEMLRLAAHHATTLTKDGSTRSSGRSRVKWVFFGTERIKAFMRDELNAKIVDLTRIYGVWPAEAKRPNTMLDCVEHWIKPHLGSDTLDMVTPARWREYEEARKGYLSQSSSRISGDIQSVRRAFYSMVLSGPVLGKLFEKNGKLALTLLRNLAFIGFPTEASVLAHCPAVRARSSFSGQDKAKAPPTLAALRQTLELLCQYGLVMKIPGFKDYVSTGADPEPRYALHRSLLGEMRYRFGIPLSEAKLSTAFNMSLYVAQPVDGSIPEPEIHDELGNLVDRLIGSYRDPSGIQYDTVQVLSGQLSSVGKVVDPVKLRGAIEAAKHACRACDDDTCNEEESLLRIHRLCSPEHIQCLRAALSIIRCYYSIASILTLDSGDRLVSADRDGILLEHAERLDRLIDAYGKISLARETLRVSSIKDDFDRIFGAAEPFYADELVWLHNERGVVRLTMGDLYEARVSFERALSVNRQYVEGEDRAHNWRRIRMNQITVDLEMGDLGLAERKIAEIEEATQIVRQRRHGSELREDRLSLAIAKGYQGWCKHLRGQKGMARKLYTSALNEFAELGEARAQAYFARLAANVPEPAQDTRTRLKEIRAALGFAQSTRQMDVVYRILIVLADEYIFGPDATENSRKEANRILDDAIRYSLQTDTHRVRFEAAQIIARFRLKNGDYEGAFRHAADALTVATRNGMELRKITARALIAGIMSARGHPITAEHLVRTAIKAASRIGFETAIELAENASRQIPHISPSTGGFEPLGQ